MNKKGVEEEEKLSKLEEKIYVMADEVLDILKQLSQDNKQQLNSKIIAERMFIRDSVKKMLEEPDHETSDTGQRSEVLKDLADTVCSRFSELAPFTMPHQFDAKETISDASVLKDTRKWLNSTITTIKQYYGSISERNRELEEFMHQTIRQLVETEQHLASELTSHQQKFFEDRAFESTISTSMTMIEEDFQRGNDIKSIKKAVMAKIENINKGIERKREQDLQRLRETEHTLHAMSERIHDIKKESDAVKKRAREIEKESLRDNLTGLYNRKAYDQKIIETLANLKRYDVHSCLIVCDVDNFKKINDTFGHKVGDLALKKLAALLKEKLRVNDFISRYGGEEFTIILPHTDLSGAIIASKGLISCIYKSVFSYKDKKIPLTISIGISVFRKTDDSGTVFERADAALYLAKKSGKNTVKTEEDCVNEGSPLNEHIDPL